jgi:hypothetical protein
MIYGSTISKSNECVRMFKFEMEVCSFSHIMYATEFQSMILRPRGPS